MIVLGSCFGGPGNLLTKCHCRAIVGTPKSVKVVAKVKFLEFRFSFYAHAEHDSSCHEHDLALDSRLQAWGFELKLRRSGSSH